MRINKRLIENSKHIKELRDLINLYNKKDSIKFVYDGFHLKSIKIDRGLWNLLEDYATGKMSLD
jgi:predicted patatin/cPLA2 family phospholipase